MFLMFTLRRLDVWPVGDLGVRAGYGLAYGLAECRRRRSSTTLGERLPSLPQPGGLVLLARRRHQGAHDLTGLPARRGLS